MGTQNQVGIAILFSYKVEFNLKLIRRDKEAHCIQQEDKKQFNRMR